MQTRVGETALGNSLRHSSVESHKERRRGRQPRSQFIDLLSTPPHPIPRPLRLRAQALILGQDGL